MDRNSQNESQFGGEAKMSSHQENSADLVKVILGRRQPKDEEKIVSILDSIPEEPTPVEVSARIPQSSAETIPLLSIDVNFGPNLHDKITVFAGDDLKQLAREFTSKHGLSNALENKLLSMLQEQVRSLS